MYLDFYSGFILLLIFVILVFATILFKKYVAFYLNFPNASLLLIVLRWMVMSGIKKNSAATKSLLETLQEKCIKLQKEGLCVLWLHKPYIVICNEKTMKAFKHEPYADDTPNDYKLLREAFGTCLLTADTDVWRIRRKLIHPAFKTSALKYHVPTINESAVALVNKLKKLSNETPVHIVRLLQSCVLANITELMSGNAAKEPEKRAATENTVDMVNMVSSSLTYRLFRPWLRPMTVWKTFSHGQNYIEATGKYHNFSKNLLVEMKESVLSKKEKDLGNDGFYDAPKSFAQLLVQQHLENPELTFKAMHDEIKFLISAGFNTTSHTLMWALLLLGHDDEVQEKLFNELDDFMINDLTFNDLQHLPYLDSVVKETVRLYPVIPLYAKSLVKEVQYEKYTFPKDTLLLFMPYVAHRDPTYYTDPEKFYPERFLEKNPDKKIATYAFGEGVRPCIGKQFALVQVKIVLAHLVKNFKITSLDRKEDVRLHWEIVLSTTKPIYFKFSQRIQKQTH